MNSQIHRTNIKVLAIFLIALGIPLFAGAQGTSQVKTPQVSGDDPLEAQESEADESETIYVFGSKDKAFLVPGSAQFIDKEEVKKFEYTDATRLLQATPGVYIQEEDGLGLRPNIGLRGATPHRSKKITVLEDGVLSGPAPYSAPAAYYFPNLLRTNEVEVFKGYSSTIYGPNSIGGALNFVTTEVSPTLTNEISATIGPVRKYKLMSSGPIVKNWNYLVEYNRADSNGIKTLPKGGDTGFYKNDILLKTKINISKNQTLDLKGSFSNETSNETYLGLTNSDFNSSPYSRYGASALDKMEWEHKQIQMRYNLKFNESVQLNTVAYYHDFSRRWNKLSSFRNGVHISEYLDENSKNYDEHFYQVLVGNDDSVLASGEDYLVLGDNNRSYKSTGFQASTSFDLDFSPVYIETRTGARIHKDSIRRYHEENTFKMIGGNLVSARNEFESELGTQNQDQALAFTYFVNQDFDFKNGLILNWAGRYEHVNISRVDFKTSLLDKSHQDLFSPGLGLQYSPNDSINLIAGVNRGLSVIGPGQNTNIDPEESINYELGIKFNTSKLNYEVIGFFSDYKNIKGFCSFSSGCGDEDLGKEFNGGRADVYGVESSLIWKPEMRGVDFTGQLSYTYTSARFDGTFNSENREWGLGQVESGVSLPYIPTHKLSYATTVEMGKASGAFKYNWQSSVFDQAVLVNRRKVASYGFVDLIGKYKLSQGATVHLGIENLFDSRYVVSLRPFGARPGKSRSVNLGLNYVF